MKRRDFLKASALTASTAALAGMTPAGRRIVAPGAFPTPHLRNPAISEKVLILGIDGMDPVLLKRMMDDGEMPTFRRLAERGHFGPLRTTMPPQSPVAWSSFITGTNPGGHGIYDFIHRDPAKFSPYLSTSRSTAGGKKFDLGPWSIPLESGRVDLMRKGRAFWSVLEEAQIPSTLYSLPANFPVVPESDLVRATSGMGTPDLTGGYGVYTYITENEIPGASKFTGGRVIRVTPKDHRVDVQITGPQNPFRREKQKVAVPLSITRDPSEEVAKFEVAGHRAILQQGEWSDWMPLSFELFPLFAAVDGMVRIYAKQIHPTLEIYVSPVQIDPMNPSMPICNPASYSRELSQAVGRFYTQGLPADTKGLSEGVLTSADFFSQSKIVLEENMRAFDYELGRFDEGCFLFYFSSLDQNSHMLWRCMDPTHPLYEPDASAEVKGAIRWYYRQMDEALRRTMEKVDSKTTLLVLSDHGFGSFTREFHLNTWLYREGFLSLTRPDKLGEIDFFQYVDWSKTKAYGLGINGLYLNLRGREKNGSVDPSEAPRLKAELQQRLAAVTDPKTGDRVILGVYDSEKIYSGPFTPLAPDLMMGYAKNYRVSDDSILGKFPRETIGDRTDKWSADHCIDPSVVPGVLMSNKPLRADANPGIWDLAPTILKAFGQEAPPEMTGTVLI